MERTDLNPEIVQRLMADYAMTEHGEYLRGRCPECDKKTLWTWRNKPGRVQCDRTNNCDYSATSKELFPDLFENISKKYVPTQTKPNATADAYLTLMRGLNIAALKGQYTQETYSHPKGNRSTPTVRFYLNDEKTIIWERLIDDVTITDDDGDLETRNKNFKGSFKGLWWKPSNISFNDGDEVYWCEGILDAISLNQNGYKAVAIMSSGTFPSASMKPYLKKNITWVLALDNDATGRKFLKKHSDKLRDMGENVCAVLSSKTEQKADWNDLHKANKLTDKDMAGYRHLGQLALARTYTDKASLIWHHNESRTYFIFAHSNRTYSAKIDPTEYSKAVSTYWGGANGAELTAEEVKEAQEKASEEKRQDCAQYAFSQASKIKKIASFDINFLYYQKGDSSDDGQYFFRFKLSNGLKDELEAFSHRNISGASDFKNSCKRILGAQYTGSTADLDIMYDDWTNSNPKTVRTLDYIGYDRDYKAYVFNQYAVEGSRVIKLNNESFFEVKKGGVKTMVDFRQTLNTKNNHGWLEDYQTAFGLKGVVTLVWWFGSFFAQQIRQEYQGYPFLEVIGEAGSGKSNMVDFLWRLTGKESESVNPNSSSIVGFIRELSRVSNMPVTLNETDNEKSAEQKHQKKFVWNDWKDLFEGYINRATGKKTHDNTIRKPLFPAALMAVQNIPVYASEAILTRFSHIQFDRDHHTVEGKAALDRLLSLKIKDVSGFLINSVRVSDRVLKHFRRQYPKHLNKINENANVSVARIAENHAKLMALADCLQGVLPGITDEYLKKIHKEIEKMAATRQTVVDKDSETMQQFWSQFHYLDSLPQINEFKEANKVVIEKLNQLNHAPDPASFIAVNIEQFQIECRNNGLPMIETSELRRQLPSSRTHEFVEKKVMHSAIEKRSIRCWVFKR